MPIFSRRRIQNMLNELHPALSLKGKTNDLVARLNDTSPEQVLGAEMELAVLWSIQQVADLEIEPGIPGSSSKPEAYSESLLDKPCYVEVTALSDGKLSGEQNMQRAANKIVAYINTRVKNIGKYLHFSFREQSGWVEGNFFRRRCITSDFEIDDGIGASFQIMHR